ncbi:MAG: hypothetical protein ACFFG0_17515 [Candidatus Thorarchaeota archaeon]
MRKLARIPLNAVTDYIYQKVFEEFWLTTGVPLNHKEIAEYQRQILRPSLEFTSVPHIASGYKSSQGGLHKSDIAIYAVFFAMKKAELGIDWAFGLSGDEYHWYVEYDDTSPQVTASLELVGYYYKFKSLANYLELHIFMPLQMQNIPSILKQELDKKIQKITERYWIEQKEMERVSASQMEKAIEGIIRNMPEDQKKEMLRAITDREAVSRMRKALDKIDEYTEEKKSNNNTWTIANIEFDDEFSYSDLKQIERFIIPAQRAIQELEDVRANKLREKARTLDFPRRVYAMTSQEIEAGRRIPPPRGPAGHGLFIPPNTIKINATMSAGNVLLNYIHENLHWAFDELSEEMVDRLTIVIAEKIKAVKEGKWNF